MLADSLLSRINKEIRDKNSIVCCGLDPDTSKLPSEFHRFEIGEGILRFLNRVVDITLPFVSAYKIQKAYFDVHPFGHEILKQLIIDIKNKSSSIPIIVDSKIGDIDNTMEAYYRAMFDMLGADAITLNPFMGNDVWKGLKDYPDKSGFVLIRTSNPAASLIQDVQLHNGEPYWQYLLKILVAEWKDNFSIIPIVSDHGDIDVKQIRKIVPDEMPIFFAGAGVQNANMDRIRYLCDKSGNGILVNSSRALVFPYTPDNPDWSGLIEKSTHDFKDRLNDLRRQ